MIHAARETWLYIKTLPLTVYVTLADPSEPVSSPVEMRAMTAPPSPDYLEDEMILLMQSTQDLTPHFPSLALRNKVFTHPLGVKRNSQQTSSKADLLSIPRPTEVSTVIVKPGDFPGDAPNLPNQKVWGAKVGNVHFWQAAWGSRARYFRITGSIMRERKGGTLLPVICGTGCGGLTPGKPYLVGEVRSTKLWAL